MIKYVFKLKDRPKNRDRSLFALKTMNLLKEKYKIKYEAFSKL